GRVLAGIVLLCMVALRSPAAEPERPRLQAGVLSGPVRIGGGLHEPHLAAGPASSDLTMVQPPQGARAPGPAIVQVLASPRELVFGIRCDDPDASRIVSFTKERDGDLDTEDHVLLLIDPFQDGRSGYVFQVNPGGARVDALVNPGGESVDKNWDGEW